jgi:phosphoribosyl 1,2-cyclic phosphate phosphodiesterase
MSLRVTLLGTGGSAGVPQIGGPDGAGDWGTCDPTEPRNCRTRSSILLQGQPGGALLVDTSPDMRAQLLANRVPGVDCILFTHSHADHVLGLDDVRALNRIAGRPLNAYGTPSTLDELQARFAYVFRPWVPPGFFRPVLVASPIAPGETIAVAGMDITVFDQDHGFTRSLGLRCGGFGYSTDVVELDEAAFAVLEGVDTWVVGCFQLKPHRTHAWLGRIYEWANRLRPRRIVLTHMGSEMDYHWLQSNLPPGIEPGFDGQVLDIA